VKTSKRQWILFGGIIIAILLLLSNGLSSSLDLASLVSTQKKPKLEVPALIKGLL